MMEGCAFIILQITDPTLYLFFCTILAIIILKFCNCSDKNCKMSPFLIWNQCLIEVTGTVVIAKNLFRPDNCKLN